MFFLDCRTAPRLCVPPTKSLAPLLKLASISNLDSYEKENAPSILLPRYSDNLGWAHPQRFIYFTVLANTRFTENMLTTPYP